MRQPRLIGTGLAVLLGVLGWASEAGAQLTTGPNVPASASQAAPTPAAPAATQTQASKPPTAPGTVTVRVGGRMIAGFGAASGSGLTR
jgi:hypothetical protein